MWPRSAWRRGSFLPHRPSPGGGFAVPGASCGQGPPALHLSRALNWVLGGVHLLCEGPTPLLLPGPWPAPWSPGPAPGLAAPSHSHTVESCLLVPPRIRGFHCCRADRRAVAGTGKKPPVFPGVGRGLRPTGKRAGQDGCHRLAESRNLLAGVSADGGKPAASVYPWSARPGEGQLLLIVATFVNKRCFGKPSSRAASVHTQAWRQRGPVRAFLACFCLRGDGRDTWPLGDSGRGWRGLGLAVLGATELETVGPGGTQLPRVRLCGGHCDVDRRALRGGEALVQMVTGR